MGKKSAIATLTDEMKGWASGEPDLRLTVGAKNRYLKAIGELRTVLKTATSEVIGELKTVDQPSPGKLKSAIAVREELIADAADFETAVNEYLEYLKQFEETVNDACTRLLNDRQ